MAYYNVHVPWAWILHESWPKLSSGAQTLYLDVCRLVTKRGWNGDDKVLPICLRLMHKDVRTGQCPEAFRRARRELCRAGILRREKHGKKGTALRDYYSLRKPPKE